jgi:hypothetical protein
MEPAIFMAMDLSSHFKELSKQKGEPNYALDILVFIRVRLMIIHHYIAEAQKSADKADHRKCR